MKYALKNAFGGVKTGASLIFSDIQFPLFWTRFWKTQGGNPPNAIQCFFLSLATSVEMLRDIGIFHNALPTQRRSKRLPANSQQWELLREKRAGTELRNLAPLLSSSLRVEMCARVAASKELGQSHFSFEANNCLTKTALLLRHTCLQKLCVWVAAQSVWKSLKKYLHFPYFAQKWPKLPRLVSDETTKQNYFSP